MIFMFQQVAIILGIISFLYFLSSLMDKARELFAANTNSEQRSRDLELWQKHDVATAEWRTSAVAAC